jgi:hypothetical protein
MYSMEAESDCFPQNKTKTASIVLTPVSVGTENSTQSIQDVGSCRQTVQWSVAGATHSRRCSQKPWTRQCLSTCMLRLPLAPCGLPLRYVALFSSRFLWLTGYHPDTGARASSNISRRKERRILSRGISWDGDASRGGMAFEFPKAHDRSRSKC